jgi:hypothetical protein
LKGFLVGWSKLLRSILVAPLLVGVLVTVGAAPASAQASGCGFQCDDQDPLTYWVAVGQYDGYNCTNDAQTVLFSGASYNEDDNEWAFKVELRYSPRCRTAWAKGTPQGTIWVERKSPHRVEDAPANLYDNFLHHTRMVNDAGMVSRACYAIPIGGGTDEACTGWY